MKKHIESIREGFLKATGARILDTLLAGLGVVGVLAIGLLSRSSTESRILSALCLISMAAFGFFWWRSRRRIQSLQREVSYLRSGLVVHSARYDVGDKKTDVALYIERQIAAGCRKIPVGNSLLDGADDPYPNAKKTGVVEYSRHGKRETQTVIEDGGYFDFTNADI
jgi:hypothetical protein